MLPTAAALGLDLNTTIGALLLGGLVSAMFVFHDSEFAMVTLIWRSRRLYGITSTQTAVYYQREHGDRLLVKGVVIILWCASYPFPGRLSDSNLVKASRLIRHGSNMSHPILVPHK